MSLKKWKSASLCTKIATVCVGLSALVGLILGFILIDDLEDSFSALPIDMSSFLVVYLLLWYGIDFVVMAGLLFVKRWARSIAIWWGVLSALSIIMAIKNPTAIFISYALSVLAAILLVVARKDFAKNKA